MRRGLAHGIDAVAGMGDGVGRAEGAVGVERESGTVAITSAANVQLAVKSAAEPIRRVDESELSATDRALI